MKHFSLEFISVFRIGIMRLVHRMHCIPSNYLLYYTARVLSFLFMGFVEFSFFDNHIVKRF